MNRSKLCLSVALVLVALMALGASSAAGQYNESPMLAEMVRAGLLPPVAERLPSEPYVVGPGDLILEEHLQFEIGRYGGTLRLAQVSPASAPDIFIGNAEPLAWAPGAMYFDRGFEGNVLKDVEFNEDYTEFTFHMRAGLKWSDGQPVTIEDVRFTWEDVVLNTELTPAVPLWFRPGELPQANPGELTILDDLTFRITFDEPYGNFRSQLGISRWRGYEDFFFKPAHYLKQFHKDYASEEQLRTALAAAGLGPTEWVRLFHAKDCRYAEFTSADCIGFPVLKPWMIVRAQDGVFTYERNPYYFKVDTAGNQLPYIDRIRSVLVQDKEMMVLSAISGELDYLGENASLRQVGIMQDNAARANYRVLLPKMHRTTLTFFLNMTYPDPVWRQVVHQEKFRQALAYAIDYEEFIDSFYFGFAQLPETTPGVYDPARANRLLDEIGMNRRDADGFRLGPDGTRFTIPFEVFAYSTDHIPATELLAEFWKAVGINTTVRVIDSSLFNQRRAANELKAFTMHNHDNIWDSSAFNDQLENWSPLWKLWFESGETSGEAPPEWARPFFSLYAQFMRLPSGSPESLETMAALRRFIHDRALYMNAAEHVYFPTIYSNRLGNLPLPEDGLLWHETAIGERYSMEQWFLKE